LRKSPVKIVGYDVRWPLIYAEERDRIQRATGDRLVAIEHVGSTAVPRLGAKPIIDIMVAVRELSDANECISPLKGIGYEYVPEYEKEIPERRFFRKGPEDMPNGHFHLHMVKQSGAFWKEHLLFRDYLRSHPEVAQQYWKLKVELARRFSSDRGAYTEAKTSFIESVISEAKAKPRLHLRYLRLPAQTLETYDDLIYKSKRIIVGKSQITSAHSIQFDDKLVLTAGFPTVYFELIGKWFNVVKIRDLKGKHTGYYCDISTPLRLLEDGSVEATDLFLDIWVSPDLRYKVLDQNEFEEAIEKKWISKHLYERAKMELKKLIELVEQKEFPPRLVRHLEERLEL